MNLGSGFKSMEAGEEVIAEESEHDGQEGYYQQDCRTGALPTDNHSGV